MNISLDNFRQLFYKIMWWNGVKTVLAHSPQAARSERSLEGETGALGPTIN
jgi:calcineurin-like phosphoesterase family protein